MRRRAGEGRESVSTLNTNTGLAPMPAFGVVSEGRENLLAFGDNREEKEGEDCGRIDSLRKTKAGIGPRAKEQQIPDRGDTYLIVFPVLSRIHCGIGRFCFCALASFCLVRKDLWDCIYIFLPSGDEILAGSSSLRERNV